VRERRARRQRERDLRKSVRQLERVATGAPGGAATHPLNVASAAVIDGRARSVPCVQCGGELEPGDDRASSTARGVLRELEMTCRRCHAPRRLWFLIASSAAN
jgi:hypothetical protein